MRGDTNSPNTQNKQLNGPQNLIFGETKIKKWKYCSLQIVQQ